MNNITELVFILDCSGSMAGLERDTIGGFNAMLEKQKRESGTAYVSTVLFNTDSRVLHDRLPLRSVPPMAANDYTVGGGTALLDALGGAIHHIGNIHKYARREDVPARTLFVIITDGMENASRFYSADIIRRKISRQRDKYGWEFLFLGANIDAIETARRFGIGQDHAADYRCDSRGTALNYEAVGEAVSAVRNNAPLSASWKRRVDEDFAARNRR